MKIIKNLMTYSLCILLICVFYSCKPHPSSKYPYYSDLKTRWIPVTKGKLMCGDTTLIAYEMNHTTAGVYNTWWITEDGHKIVWTSSCSFMEMESLPSFRSGEELTDFQIANAD